MRIKWGIYPPGSPYASLQGNGTSLSDVPLLRGSSVLSCTAMMGSSFQRVFPTLSSTTVIGSRFCGALPTHSLCRTRCGDGYPKVSYYHPFVSPGMLRCIEWWPQSDMSTSKPQTETATITIFGRKKKRSLQGWFNWGPWNEGIIVSCLGVP